MAIPVPEPLGFTTGFSPNIETFKSLGEPYFLTNAEVQADVARWAVYPAVTNVNMDGNDITNAGAVAAGSGAFSGPVAATTFTSPNSTLTNTGTTPGQLFMDDNTGTQYPLESLDGNLYFAGELLAKAGDIQNIADWALYPAIADVDMNGKKLQFAQSFVKVDAVVEINSKGGGGGIALNPSDVVTIGATANSNSWLQTDQISQLGGAFGGAGQFLKSDGAKIVWADGPPTGVTAINPGANTGAVTLQSANGSVTITNPAPGTVNFAVPAGAGGVSSLDGITGDVILQAGAAIVIGPGVGPQNISISAPTVGLITDPGTALTAFGRANLGIADAAAAQGTADGAVADAAAAAAEAAAAAAAALAAQGTADAALALATTADAGVTLIEAAYVTKVGLAGTERSGAITLAAGANTTITEAPNGTFTFASTGGGGGVTSLNTQAGALTLTSANTNIVVGSTGAGNIQLTAPTPVTTLNTLTGALTIAAGTGISVTPSGGNTLTIANTAAGIDVNGLLNKINAYPVSPYTAAASSTPAVNQAPTAIVPDGSFPVNVPTSGAVQGGWGFSKAVGSAAYFNWYMYNPRFGAPVAPLPYIKSRIQSVWALIRPTVNLYSAGYLAFNLYSYDPANPPLSGFYNTRWAYSNTVGSVAGATGTNLFAGYTYLIYANDTPRITNTSAIGVPDSQVSTLRDPYDIYTDVNHIPLENCIVAFNPWTNGTNYKTWTAAATFVLNDTVVFAGSGTNYNGLFFRSLSISNNNHPPMTNGVVDSNWALIDPQPSTYADQPILAMNINQATASGQAVGYVVLDMGFSYGPSTTSTTVSQHISLLPN